MMFEHRLDIFPGENGCSGNVPSRPPPGCETIRWMTAGFPGPRGRTYTAPSPDSSVTDFSDESGNAITAADIAAVANGIDDGVWLVLNQGWSGFYFQGADFGKDPYINGWNYPGLTPAAVDKIIEIENAKGVRINGIMSDVIGVETGQNSRREDEAWTNSWYAHVKGLQRGWKLIENGNNLGQLAMATPGSCMLVAGALMHVRGTGGPARILAFCEK